MKQLRRMILWPAAWVAVLAWPSAGFAARGDSGPVPGAFIVKLAPGVNPAAVRQALGGRERLTPVVPGGLKAGLAGREDLERVYFLATERPAAAAADITDMLGRGNVEWVEPEYFLELFELPADSLFPRQWHLLNTGQEYFGINRIDGAYNDERVIKRGTAGRDVRLVGQYQSPPADSAEKVVVAIIDTGVDTDHPELAGRVWRNLDEIPGNGGDDDHNGYIDDTAGYDISGDTSNLFDPAGDADPRDEDGHGTHCAGIVGANGDGAGVVGIAPWIEIMPVKIFPNGTTRIGGLGILYAVNNGARVINASWGSPFQSQFLREVINFARENGVLVCMASGNSGDNSRFYPAGFDLDSTLVVGAGNSDGELTYFSTFGSHVDIIAPGLDILSLRAAGTDMYAAYPAYEPEVRIVDSLYYLSDGTSMAAPMVCGAAGMLLSFRPDLSLGELVAILKHGATDLVDPLNQGDDLPGPDSLCGWGYLNIDASLGLMESGGMYLTAPEHRSRHTGDIIIKGGTIGGYDDGWTIEYATGLSPEAWHFLAAGNGLPPDSVLAVFRNPGAAGLLSFRLTDSYGRSGTVTVTYAPTNVLAMSSPADGMTFDYAIPVRGSAYGPDFDSLVVKSRGPRGNVVRLFAGTGEVFDSLFYTWPASGADTGAFTLYLYGYFATGVEGDSAGITVTSAFADGWPRRIPGWGGMTAVSADLNRDGSKELIAATSGGLAVYRAADGELLSGFPALAGRDVRCVPAVYDVDGDGHDEIIVTDSTGLHVIRDDGTAAPGWPQACFTGMTPYEYGFPAPVIVELRRGSPPGAVPDSGILFINRLGQLIAFRFNGDRYFYSRKMWGQFDARISPSYLTGGDTSPFATAADVDGDGRREVCASFSSANPHTGMGLFDGANGRPAFGRDVPTIQTIASVSGSVLADLDGDGLPEAITTGLGDDDLEHVWIKTLGTDDFASWVVPIDDSWIGWIASYPVVADLDRDGTPEILMTYFEFDQAALFIFRADGTPYATGPRGIPGEAFYDYATFATPAVANIMGDEYPEIIFRAGHLLPGTGPELLYILDYAAVPVAGWPKRTPAPSATVASGRQVPLVDDLDNDGKVELALLSDEQSLLVWDFEGSYDEGRNTFRWMYDNGNSGIYPGSQAAPQSSDGPARVRKAQRSAAGEARAVGRATAPVRFNLPAPARVAVEIYDTAGKRVATLPERMMEAGDQEMDFSEAALAPGMYFYRLIVDGTAFSRRMAVIE